MSTHQGPSVIQNTGLVKDPAKRRVIEIVLGAVGLVLGTVIVTDGASDAFDVTAFTMPASVAFMYVSATLGFGATLPNIPKR